MIKKIYSKWKKIAEKVVDFQIKVIFSILYYLMVVPVAFVIKKVSPIKNEKKWQKITDNFSTIEKLKLQ